MAHKKEFIERIAWPAVLVVVGVVFYFIWKQDHEQRAAMLPKLPSAKP